MPGYTIKVDETRPHALGRDIDISPKHAIEICREVRGMPVDDAVDYLERVEEKKQAVAFKRFNKQVASKKGIGPGRYPVKAARAIRRVIEDALNNAEVLLGSDSSDLRLLHIASHQARTVPGYIARAHGRSTAFDHQRVNIEVVLEELEK